MTLTARLTMADEIVKIRKVDLKALIDANIEAYNLLDDIGAFALSDISGSIKKATSTLEAAPSDMSDIIVEDDDDTVNEVEPTNEVEPRTGKGSLD